MKMKSINILYQSSAAYAIPAAVSICSLLENNKQLDEINIWFSDAGLTEEDRNELGKLCGRYGRKITFLNGKSVDTMLENAGVRKWSESYATFYKIFICCGMKEIDRILYIDSDTVILDSLEELCDYDMDGYACAMAGSGMTGTLKRFMGLTEYFNAGVIYFNLDYWRKNNVEQAFINAINSDEGKKFTIVGDETLINAVLKGKIKKLPLKYNVESSWGRWGWNQKLYPQLNWTGENKPYYTDAEILEAMAHPVIGHYVDLTTGRPWDYLNDNPFRKEFEQYSNILQPWKEIDFTMRGIGGDNKAIARGKLLAKKLMPKTVRSRIAFIQHDNYWKTRIEEFR